MPERPGRRQLDFALTALTLRGVAVLMVSVSWWWDVYLARTRGPNRWTVLRLGPVAVSYGRFRRPGMAPPGDYRSRVRRCLHIVGRAMATAAGARLFRDAAPFRPAR